jgi:hypothetical protein
MNEGTITAACIASGRLRIVRGATHLFEDAGAARKKSPKKLPPEWFADPLSTDGREHDH